MKIDAGDDDARSLALVQLRDRLLATLELAERAGEFLLAAQIAVALDTVGRTLAGPDAALPEPRKVGVCAG